MRFAGLLFILIASGAIIFTGIAHSKCYQFTDGGKIRVCIKGDSFADRNKAKKVCKKAKGSDCGNVASFSSSCGNGNCYNIAGKKYHSMSGY